MTQQLQALMISYKTLRSQHRACPTLECITELYSILSESPHHNQGYLADHVHNASRPLLGLTCVLDIDE